MGKDCISPFIVGKKAEARTFEGGYRSAWFRCEVKDIYQRKGKQLRAFVKYFDYTDDEPEWLALYQVPPYASKLKEKRKILMLRPEYPVIYHEHQIADVNALQEAVLVLNGPWKVGDMVDWLSCDCYWSGRITEILGTKNAKFELIRPPEGQGGCYDVSVEELRPTLEWSIESGWTLPISEDLDQPCCLGRLLYPTRQEYDGGVTVESLTERQLDEGCSDMSIPKASAEKQVSYIEELAARPPDESCLYRVIREASVEKRISHIGESSADNRPLEDLHQFSGCYQEVMSVEGLGTLEGAVLGLEELLNKVKWLKRSMKDDIPLSKSGGASWQFVEHHG